MLGIRRGAGFHRAVGEIWVISGSDTGAGKTVFTAELCRWLGRRGHDFRALKPLCSGGREDAEELYEAQKGRLTLDEINPWHFREPLAPPIAAAKNGMSISLRDIKTFIRSHAKSASLVLVEAAGGLLSPYASDGGALDLIKSLRARPILVVPNRLGAINQSLLVWRALPPKAAAAARLILVAQAKPDSSARENVRYLTERLGEEAIIEFPRLGSAPAKRKVNDAFEPLCVGLALRGEKGGPTGRA